MYDELVKRLREDAPTALANCDFDFVEGWIKEASDAIEELAAFKAQITDGHMYCMRDGILYEAKIKPPKAKSIKLPPIKFAEPPKEET